MKTVSVGELVKRAKGEDRSLREYARDSGVDAAILSRMINGTYIPKKPGIYEALTSPQAAPRGGVTTQQLIAAAGTSEDYLRGMSSGMSVGMRMALADVPSSAMIRLLQARGICAEGGGRKEAPTAALKPEEMRRIQRLQSEAQRFTATANGIILGSLGGKGLTFQLVHTDGAEVEGIRFDTRLRLMDQEVSEYLIRYAFISEDEASDALAINTVRSMVGELVFLEPRADRVVSIVTNHPGAYEDLCAHKDRLSYHGELSVLLFDLERAKLLKEEYLSHYRSETAVGKIRLI
jgi:hypothetical protein